MTRRKHYTPQRCSVCCGPYNEEEWSERHTAHSKDCALERKGECDCPADEVHERCCPDCHPTQAQTARERRKSRGHDFWPSAKDMETMPKPYATEGQRLADKVVRWHYFTPGTACDWWLIEYDTETRTGFGYACLAGDEQCAEWGYVSLDELEALYQPGKLELNGDGTGRLLSRIIVERDLHWRPRKASECDLPGRATS